MKAALRRKIATSREKYRIVQRTKKSAANRLKVRIQRKAAMRRSGIGKYGVAPREQRTRLGVLYDSKLEMDYGAKLELLRHAIREDERVVDIRRQVSIKLEVAGHLICIYRLDFEVVYADGRVEWHEAKGLNTPVWRIKEKLVRALFPGQTLRVIKKV